MENHKDLNKKVDNGRLPDSRGSRARWDVQSDWTNHYTRIYWPADRKIQLKDSGYLTSKEG